MLDFYAEDRANALAGAAARIAPALPATFAETYDEAVRTAEEFSNTDAYGTARYRVMEDFLVGLRQKTGEDFSAFNDLAGGPDADLIGQLGDRIDALNAAAPRLELQRLTPDDVDKMTLARMASARLASAAMAKREKTAGGTLGGLVGDFAGALRDPVNIAMMPLGVAGRLGILGRTVEGAALGGAGQVANEAIAGPTRERAVPGSAEEGPGNIAMAAAGGAVLGGAFATLGRLVGLLRKDTPPSLREDLNASASEAQLSATNVLPGIEGEVAHRDAVPTAMRQVLAGEPVTAADLVPPGLRVDGIDGERALRPVTAGELPDVDLHPFGLPDGVAVESRSAHGPVLSGLEDRWADAVLTLRSYEAGDARAVLAHPDVPGRIDVIWGDEEGGLLHIIRRHPEVLADLPERLAGMTVLTRSDNRIRLSGPGGVGVISLDRFGERKTWLLTAFDPEAGGGRRAEGRMVRPDASGADTRSSAPPAGGDIFEPRALVDSRAAPLLETPATMARFAEDPAVAEGVLRDMDRIRLEKPDAVYGERVEGSDGSIAVVERKLEDVLDGLDRRDAAARELEACVVGMEGGAAAIAAKGAV